MTQQTGACVQSAGHVRAVASVSHDGGADKQVVQREILRGRCSLQMRSRAPTSAQYGELPDAALGGESSEAPKSVASVQQLGEIQEMHMTRKLFHMLWVRTTTQNFPHTPIRLSIHLDATCCFSTLSGGWIHCCEAPAGIATHLQI